MKRDDDYIRTLLFEMEASSTPFMLAPMHHSMSATELKRHQHAELLCDAGLLQASQSGVYRMTNQGHDFLEAIRSDDMWNKTKQGAAAVGGATLGILRDLALAYVRQRAETLLGVDLG